MTEKPNPTKDGISKERRSQPVFGDVIENGKAHFGTFDKEFEKLSLLECEYPPYSKKAFRRFHLTLWEAVEIHLKDAYYVSAVSDMGLFGIAFNLLFDKKENKEYHWFELLHSRSNPERTQVRLSQNLLGGKKTFAKSKESSLVFTNTFDEGKARIQAYQNDKKLGSLSADFELSSLSLPSVVSIPFGDNQPLYTEKQFFKASGKLTALGRTYESDENSTAVIDDHRGYYPKSMHYDWLAFLGKDSLGKWFAFNLTQNQSIDPYRYNENLIWREKRTSLLPPVTFTKDQLTKDFVSAEKTPTAWLVQDDLKKVQLSVSLRAVYKNQERHLFGRFTIDYFFIYGLANGYVTEEDGTRIELTDFPVLGEDKSVVMP
jgi:hypothetical protein